MAIDEATQALLAAVAATGRKPLHESTPVEAREASARSAAMFGLGPEMLSVDDRTLTAAEGGSFDIRVFIPRGDPQAVVVYLHGGGWVVGNLDGFDTLGRKLASQANSVVVLVNYRLAPEAPFPVAVEDTWAALQWAGSEVENLAGSPVPLIVGGDSAGGNLAIVTALRARTQGPTIDFTFLVYPVTDSDMSTRSYLDPANQLMLSKQGMEWFFDHYTGAQDRSHPEISPLRSDDLSGFPPSIVLIAEHDPLRAEGEAFAERLAAVGSLVDSRLFEGQMHGFFSMVNVLPASDTALDFIVEHINSRTNNHKEETK